MISKVPLCGEPQAASYSATEFNPPAPDGYVIGSNNSPTIPVVTGMLSDLISEARREHVRYNAERLNNAIFTGTRLLDGFPLSQQGYGLINAANSWDQLVKMAKADDPANPELTSFTVSRVEERERIGVQGFHADLPDPGDKLEGEIWITRHAGYAGGRKYTFALRGNNGSFELQDHEATLEQGKPTRIRFRTSGVSGWNIAFLELRDVKADVVMKDVPLSVRNPDVPQNIAPGIERYTADIPPLRMNFKYIHTANEVQAARYIVQIPYTHSEGYFPGERISQSKSPAGVPLGVHHVGPIQTYESLTLDTTPGTQEMWWENRGRPEYSTPYDPPAPDVSIHAELTVTKYEVAIKHDGDSLKLTNKLAEVEGRTVLYDASLQSETMAGAGPHASVDVQREFSAHLTRWRIDVTASSLPDNSADVFLLNCTDPKSGCYVAAQQAVGKNGPPLVIDDPKEGDWRIVIRTREPIDNPIAYHVREAMLTPSNTPIEASDSKHASGASWSVALPAKQGDAQYAAFHIEGEPRPGVTQNNTAKNGLDIALTPLDGNAP